MPSTTHFLLLTLVVLGALNCFVVLNYHYRAQDADAYSWLGHDFPETLPLVRELASVTMTVEETSLYPLGEEGDRAWRILTTGSRGYYRLGPNNRLFAVTMFHELHCLRIFNSGFAGDAELGHIVHCLSYLRHGVLCSADLTLEAGDFALRNFTRDRVGETHECRDWAQLYDTIEDNWDRWNAVKASVVGSE